MTAIFYLALTVALFGAVAWVFVNIPANRLAGVIRIAGPVAMVAVGLVLTLAGRGGIGIPMAALGLGLWQRSRGVRHQPSPSGQKSTVRSAALEMILDHDTGEMDGKVLTGSREGQLLSRMGDEELMQLRVEIGSDRESVELFEAYLDRRIPRWRENADTESGRRDGSPSGSGAMTKEEAYQVLGLHPGASEEDIRKAWRRLMKTAHPDHGGSAFLATKINAAKQVLLD